MNVHGKLKYKLLMDSGMEIIEVSTDVFQLDGQFLRVTRIIY